MAAPGPPQSMPPSSSASGPQQPPLPTHSDQITWDGDKMFNIYILDYCKKRGYRKTAHELVTEAEIAPDSKPPINAQQGLLFEWWSVFWVLFQAKNNGAGSEDAMLYHKHQTQMKLRSGQVPPPGVPTARYSLPNGVTGPVPPLSAAHINGIGPGGQPQSLSAPSPYGPPNPAAQPNGIPGPPQAPPGGAPGQQFPGGMAPRPPLGPQHQQRPNGPQYRSPTIAASPQSQGNPSQPPAGAMGQLGRSPHMSAMNRSAMPPPNGPQHPQGPGVGSAHPTPTPSYQQLGRPPSSHDISSQNPMNPHRSPALAGRMPPGHDRSHMENMWDAELASYPPEVINDAKRHAGLGDRDTQTLTNEEKQTIAQHVMRLRQNPQNSGVAGPSTHGQLQSRGPMAQPMQQQLSRIKRNSNSPGEEHAAIPRNEQSPPERKRPRRTPTAEQQQQQQPQQQHPQQQHPQQQHPQQQHPQPQQTPQPPQHQSQQPPMAPIGPLPSGPQPMSGAGSVRGPLPMGGGQPPPNGFGAPMHQMGMGPGPMTPMHAMSPGMGHGPPMGMINPQQMGQSQMLYQQGYRPGMMNPHKGNPNVPGPPLDPQSQAHLRGPPNRLPGQLVPTQSNQPPKIIGGPMPPPGQPGMSGPSKPGGKDGEGELNAPLNPAASAPTSGPHHNSAPPMNSQRPPTASAQLPTPAPAPSASGPGPMGDLSFDMTDMFGSTAGDFDFGTGSLGDMELWFDPSAVHDASIDMK